jgi:hypothetical protein
MIEIMGVYSKNHMNTQKYCGHNVNVLMLQQVVHTVTTVLSRVMITVNKNNYNDYETMSPKLRNDEPYGLHAIINMICSY